MDGIRIGIDLLIHHDIRLQYRIPQSMQSRRKISKTYRVCCYRKTHNQSQTILFKPEIVIEQT